MMLSRTADHLYWMSRYLERAENLARLLDVSFSLSLLPQSKGARAEMSAPLVITETLKQYNARHDTLSAQTLFDFMALDRDNPASIVSCLKLARENAHAVRGKIPVEMWENINATWLQAKKLPSAVNVGEFFDWVKERSHLFRGVAYGTVLRGDAYSFVRLGTFVERADNTARLLDVKASLMDSGHGVDDFYAWSALLRALSAYEAYLELYREPPNAQSVTELLLLSPRLPRSLRASMEAICKILAQIEGEDSRVAQRDANAIRNELHFVRADEILRFGLHDYLNQRLIDINTLGERIYDAYLKAA
ncbi:alpha-E domain-containing protein [Jeongeupia naejangsanensis]|uniref:Alpha-E domain-containing protein n=1 Tax=Jeongeupia naejangsanensis TaxID=613195 RepID=A0ABS2BQ48_9NEIS|nr:alpha-E domain-containing protein [Jeongeupia naejangsanensis]MBM3117752.1 alpha-E domain-containing protein [Jeongeupia naejangsanensis]